MSAFLQNVVFGTLLGGIYALVAVGLAMTYGVLKIVNVAHGALVVLGAFVTYTLWTVTGLDPLLVLPATVVIQFGVGWALYVVLFDRIRTASMASTVLLAFGLALVLEALMGFVWGNTSVAVRPGYADASFRVGDLILPAAQLFGGLVAAVALVMMWAVLTRTWLGRAITAAASNPAGAQLIGIKIGTVSAAAFALAAATAGAGGAIVSILYPFVPGSHYQWIARILAIVVLGGMGSIGGALLASLVFGLVETFTAAYVSTAWAVAVPYLVVFAVLVVRPGGLLGGRDRSDVVAI